MARWICRTNLSNLYQRLLENYQTAGNFRVRNRSQAILLSFQKYSVDDIAQICRVHRTTVCIWIDKWKAPQQRLEDQERSGRPPILNLEEQAKAIEIGLKNPKFPHRQLSEIERETGKEISQGTLKRMLKKRLSVETDQTRIMEKDGWGWKRVCPPRPREIDEKSRPNQQQEMFSGKHGNVSRRKAARPYWP